MSAPKEGTPLLASAKEPLTAATDQTTSGATRKFGALPIYHFAGPLDWLLIVVGAILHVGLGAIYALLGLFIGVVMGSAQTTEEMGVDILIYVGGGLGSLTFAVGTLGAYCASATKSRMMAAWKVEYLKAVLRQDSAWYDVNRGQELAGRMGEAMVKIEKALGLAPFNALTPLANIPTALIIAFVMSPKLAGVGLAVSLLVAVPASLTVGYLVISKAKANSEAYAHAGGEVSEALGAVRTVAAFGLERLKIDKYSHALVAVGVAVRTRTMWLAFALASLTAFIFYLISAETYVAMRIVVPAMEASAKEVVAEYMCMPDVCKATWNPSVLLESIPFAMQPEYVGLIQEPGGCPAGWNHFVATCRSWSQVTETLDSMGMTYNSSLFPADINCAGVDFVALFTAMTAIVMAFLTLPSVPGAVGDWLEGDGAAGRCLEIITTVPDIDPFSDKGTVLTSVRGNIELKNVSFAYTVVGGVKVSILNGIDLSIPAGSSMALFGPSGCGKSTIISLLERFYDPTSGAIYLDGVDLRSLNVKFLRTQLALVGQEPILFNGTISENIRLGNPDATDEDVRAAAMLANAHEFIMANEIRAAGRDTEKSSQSSSSRSGYSRLISLGGNSLSGGQKQRIAIARAMIKKPAVLLLDEATSALDNKNELEVQEALKRVMQESKFTSVIIAHRFSSIRSADKIAILKAGKVEEVSSWDELMGKKGVFYDMASREERDRNEAQAIAGHLTGHLATPPAEAAHSGKKSTNSTSDVESDEDGPLEPVEGEQTKDVFQFFRGREKFLFFLGLACCVVGGGLIGTSGVMLIKNTYPYQETFEPFNMMKTIGFWSKIAFCFGVLNHVVILGYRVCFALTEEYLLRVLRIESLSNLLAQEMEYFDKPENSAGALSEFLERKLTLAQGPVMGAGGGLTLLAVLTSGAIMTCFFGDWRTMLCFIAFLPVGITLSAVSIAKLGGGANQIDRHDDEEQDWKKEDSNEVNAGEIVGEVVTSIKTVASFNLQHHFLQGYEALCLRQRDEQLQSYPFWCAMGALGQTAISLAMAVSLWYGMRLISIDVDKYDKAPDGCPFTIIDTSMVMVAPFSFIFVLTTLPIAVQGSIDAKTGMAAVEELFKRLGKPSKRSPFDVGGVTPTAVQGKIVLADVWFGYAGSTTPALRGMDLTIEAGQACALVGPSGCGKSTVIAMLQRFYDPASGQLTLDGADLRSLNLSWMRSKFGLVGQEPVLFDGTILENIRLGFPSGEASQEDVEQAASLANAHSFIMSLSDGYNTQVGLRGGKLSGGQKQRVAIARALIRKPAVMLLDEATSALDSESEKLVQAAIDNMVIAKQKPTTIMIAHRLSTVRNADQIAVVNHGQVIEHGTHQSLMDQQGAYVALVRGY